MNLGMALEDQLFDEFQDTRSTIDFIFVQIRNDLENESLDSIIYFVV